MDSSKHSLSKTTHDVTASEPTVAVTDPVCGMKVDPATTAHKTTRGGAHHYFCSAGCLAKFTADPSKYLSTTPRAEVVSAPDAMWTCPMHPEIRQQGPGTCPICGMALEPEEPSLDDAPNPELVDFIKRFWISAVLAVPLLILTMGTEFLGLHLVDPALSPWIQLALTGLVTVWFRSLEIIYLTQGDGLCRSSIQKISSRKQ